MKKYLPYFLMVVCAVVVLGGTLQSNKKSHSETVGKNITSDTEQNTSMQMMSLVPDESEKPTRTKEEQCIALCRQYNDALRYDEFFCAREVFDDAGLQVLDSPDGFVQYVREVIPSSQFAIITTSPIGRPCITVCRGTYQRSAIPENVLQSLGFTSFSCSDDSFAVISYDSMIVSPWDADVQTVNDNFACADAVFCKNPDDEKSLAYAWGQLYFTNVRNELARSMQRDVLDSVTITLPIDAKISRDIRLSGTELGEIVASIAEFYCAHNEIQKRSWLDAYYKKSCKTLLHAKAKQQFYAWLIVSVAQRSNFSITEQLELEVPDDEWCKKVVMVFYSDTVKEVVDDFYAEIRKTVPPLQ